MLVGLSPIIMYFSRAAPITLIWQFVAPIEAWRNNTESKTFLFDLTFKTIATKLDWLSRSWSF